MTLMRVPRTTIALCAVALAALAVIVLSGWFALESRTIALANAGVAERNLARALTQNADRAIEGTNIVLRTAVDLVEQAGMKTFTEDTLHAFSAGTLGRAARDQVSDRRRCRRPSAGRFRGL